MRLKQTSSLNIIYCDVVFDDLYLEQEIEKIKKKKKT